MDQQPSNIKKPNLHKNETDTANLVLSPEEVRLLVEVGFLAAGNGFTRSALKIFAALKLVRPTSAFPIVGQALALLNHGSNSQAIKLLGEVRLDDEHEQQEVNAWFGFALQQGKFFHKAKIILERTAYENPELRSTNAAKMAMALLERGSIDKGENQRTKNIYSTYGIKQ